jgi:hypothetical protein
MRSTALKRYTRLRPFSKKRAAQRAARAECVRIVLERDGQHCQFWNHVYPNGVGAGAKLTPNELGQAPNCWGPLDVHELVKRSQKRDAYLDPDNCEALCRAHNEWVESRPVASRRIGLNVRRSYA